MPPVSSRPSPAAIASEELPERAADSFRAALRDIGYGWHVGKAAAISEYGVPYIAWRNGVRKEREYSADDSSITHLSWEGLKYFDDAWKNGARYIVWRIAPEFERHRDAYRLYFRFHTLTEAPEGHRE